MSAIIRGSQTHRADSWPTSYYLQFMPYCLVDIYMCGKAWDRECGILRTNHANLNSPACTRMRGLENKSHEPKLSRLHAQDEEIWTQRVGRFTNYDAPQPVSLSTIYLRNFLTLPYHIHTTIPTPKSKDFTGAMIQVRSSRDTLIGFVMMTIRLRNAKTFL